MISKSSEARKAKCIKRRNSISLRDAHTFRSFPHSWLVFANFVTRLTQRVPLVEQELLILSEYLSSSPVFSGVRVTRSLVVCVCFVDRCLFFCTFSFGHCVVCSSAIYGFWLPLWYLQTLLSSKYVLTWKMWRHFFSFSFIVLVFLVYHDVLPNYPLTSQPCIYFI
jgi:hypothetical protein